MRTFDTRAFIVFLIVGLTIFLFVLRQAITGAFMGGRGPASAGGYDIVIIAGQSNSTSIGQGPYTDALAGPVDGVIDQLGRFGADNFRVVPAKDDLQDWNQEKRRSKNQSGVGFATAFARLYASRAMPEGRRTLLIPAGLGGSSILLWDGKVEFPGDNLDLLSDLVKRVEFAMNLPGANRLVAVLWHQGESDVDIASSAPGEESNVVKSTRGQVRVPKTLMPGADQYAVRLANLITALRRAFRKPNLPFIAGELNRARTREIEQTRAFVEKTKSVIAVSPFSAFVSSQNLASNPDQDFIHFSAQGEIDLGKRYFEEFARLTGSLAR